MSSFSELKRSQKLGDLQEKSNILKKYFLTKKLWSDKQHSKTENQLSHPQCQDSWVCSLFASVISPDLETIELRAEKIFLQTVFNFQNNTPRALYSMILESQLALEVPEPLLNNSPNLQQKCEKSWVPCTYSNESHHIEKNTLVPKLFRGVYHSVRK